MDVFENKIGFEEAFDLLKRLIAVPSFSNEEEKVADLWVDWLRENGAQNVNRFHNNVYALSSHFNPSKPILLLNSHLDTVKPVASYTRDPFNPIVEDGKLYGLGSNDAGASGVCLAATFLNFKDRNDLPFNLLLAISACEEKMGETGMRVLLPFLKQQGFYPSMAIVGEPTGCEAAIAERGLVVCDALTTGKAGHAARNVGINALYRAIDDIRRIQEITWSKQSEILGPVKATVTMIEAGTQHNVVPDKCKFVVDIRTTDALSNEETVEELQKALQWSVLTPRSTRIRASVLPVSSPLFQAAINLDLKTFVSPTTSDMANMHDFDSLKIGPGKSERSHTADEFIEVDEIKQGLTVYEDLINSLINIMHNS